MTIVLLISCVTGDLMMSHMILLVVGLLGLAGEGSAQLTQNGQCGTINLMQIFVLNTFATETWYEVGKTSSQNADCSNLQFTTNTDGTISVSNPSVVNNFLQTSTGTATQNAAGSAQLTLTLSGNSIDFRILGTDYNNYAIAISCVDTSPTQRTVNVWQLGRSVNSYDTPATLTAANNLLAAIGLTVSNLQSIDHSTNACTQLPVIGDGQPVILAGQCATASLPVVQDFNVPLFGGTWHEISSYYSANAVGTCAKADYTLVGTIVNVVNSQVLNQRLDTITGTATLIGTDGSGRLSVTLDVQGVPIVQELLILRTDYTGYAVSYSCFDLPNNQRQVNSWILSRTKQISAASLTAVNDVIASLVDLNDAYYIATDQSDNGCFYFPTHQPGVPVVFPGQCDNTVAAIPSFSLAQFVGTWHEVEAYPKQQQTGTCVNHAFTTGTANSLNLVSNQVVNQAATSGSGSITIVSTDGSGRLSLTMTTGGQTIQFPYWILATDYNSYALAYSCENVDDNYRAVHTWKLSRAQTLSASATTAINAAMAAVQVVDQQYFENIDQTDAGCFYFPTVEAGTPVIFPGQCDTTVPVQANFDPVAYMGLWHEIESYPSTFQTGSCNNAYYTLEGSVVGVFNTQVINQQLDTINGTAIIPDASEPAKLLVSFPVAGTDQTTSTEYWVLSTDYTSYSLVYTCASLPNNQRAVFSWKLSRSKALTAAANVAINAVTANIQVLDSRYYVQQDQTEVGCFFFPEFEAGTPVVFPGQCDTTVPVQANFDPVAYMGLWHEIESYPSTFQTGSCSNAYYTLEGSVVGVFNTQVINQQLDTINGTAIIPDASEPAKLLVSFPVAGTDQTISTEYWVLSTDYTSYSLVYTCASLPNNQRAVFSWKLSRSKELTAAANVAINAVTANIQVLDSRYYVQQDQTEVGCFFFPEFEAGTPVVFPGQCDTTVPVQANFDPVAYMGLWHEIESYPSTFQTGSCSNAYYTLEGSVVGVFNTQVINQQLDTINGTAIIPDASEPAKLLVSFPVAGTDQTISTEYWVLSTDYTSYSLVYTCASLPNNQRAVFSWKLSRSKALTAAANVAINAATANIQVLDSRYYVQQDQTEVGCFYYPVFEETPEAIILPGSCPAVSAVGNFNPTAYLGEWFDVARYPIASQSGTCSRAQYSLVDGVITIRNTMVVNETLRVQDGIARLSATGTGLLQVTFVLENGVETVATYLILGTDYVSYSLVYNCRNLEDGTRRVFSWKLSRTPTLTAAANTAIDNIVNNIQGLNEDYYQIQSQTNQDCFYVPELVPGESVLFRGSCDQVTGMQGFDASQYLGWWHEIERYPSDGSPGHCTSANFVQTSTNAIQVIESDVYNGVANETTNVAVLSADGTITITRNGVASRYVVIATDYNTYSLLYSCEEVLGLASPQRRVWSAKHSKARSLSAAAEAAMTTYIEVNPVLHQHLYESVNQTDSACFHYREDASEQVILPGQCDTTIPVQANFDLSQFAGTWYQIERYPYPQVSNDGTCIGARYTVNGDSVTVLNWEVLDGVLNTKEGTASVNGATLTVTLPVEGSDETVTKDLHILSTDYEDFALAYTCVNINAFERSVGAFKLSRSRRLSNAGQYAIGTYMANREELHQPYFISVSQHDDCEEPSSAFLFKSSIIVMLVCVVVQLVT